MLYWICKKEIAVVRRDLLLNLIENPGVTELIETQTQSTGTILKMILVLVNVVREIIVDKIKQSDGYTCLKDEKQVL